MQIHTRSSCHTNQIGVRWGAPLARVVPSLSTYSPYTIDATTVIRGQGNHIQHYMNGRLILDFTDADPDKALLDGIFAVQLHGGKPMWAEFKNVRIANLD